MRTTGHDFLHSCLHFFGLHLSSCDARVSGAIHGASETTEMYRGFIETAPHDRTNQVVKLDCPKCGLDYAVQIRVGDAEVVIRVCKCGHESYGSAQ